MNPHSMKAVFDVLINPDIPVLSENAARQVQEMEYHIDEWNINRRAVCKIAVLCLCSRWIKTLSRV